MTFAVAQAKHIFGFKSGISGNICYHDEHTVIFPCGALCVLYNIDQKSQKFIPSIGKGKGITALAVSPNRRYIAIGEQGEKPILSIYDLHSLRKRKTLISQDVQSTEFACLGFSPDSKYLFAQTGGPDWIGFYYTWEKSKVMATASSSNHQGAPIYQVSFNPQDNTQVCLVGNGILKCFRYSEGNLKPFSFPKQEPQNYLCHTWVSDERLIVGADNGRIYLFEAGELKNEFNLMQQKDKKAKPDDRVGVREITAVVSLSKGFVCACGPGTVYLFEKTDDKEYFKKTREIQIPPDNNSCEPSKSQEQNILCMTVSPSEETLVITTDINQMYSATLSVSEIGKQGEQVYYFDTLAQSFHSNKVTGLDVCIHKPLVATCSLDCSIRIWNFETCNLDLYKEFSEEAYSIALHPSGLYILVGFSDKLRLMNILIDDIRMFKEFSIRGCRECSFSHGGHLFAAVHSNIIQLYSTATFDIINNLKGHNGKVQSVIWNSDDSKIVSCGLDGAVYEWESFTGKRIGESVLKSCAYTGVGTTPDGKVAFAVGSDQTLKEISDSQVLREVQSGEVTLTSVAMSHSGRMLFVGTADGALWCMNFPLTVPGEWQEHLCHGASVVKMKFSFDDQCLITVSEDSTVMLWKIQDPEGRSLKREREVAWAEEILITKCDLEEKNTIMAELKTRVDELKMENEYQLRLKDMNYNEKIKELTEKFIQEMESLKTKNQVLKTDKDKEEVRHEEEMAELMEKHAKELQDLESANNQKLMLEYEKFQELQVKMMKMQEDYDKQFQDLEENKELAQEKLTEYYEAKLQEMSTKLEQAFEEGRQQNRESEETIRQIEEDADAEILDIKNKYERRLKDEQEMNIRLKGENGIMKKKFTTLQKEIEDHKEECRKFQAEINKLNNIIRNLEKDIAGLKKEIQERDDTIQDKEKRIYDLKKKNQELEKFKFVLDYKIKELKKQIEPRELEIKMMKEQIQDMESELERFHKQNLQLEMTITELRQKYAVTSKELHQERQRKRDIEAVVRRFKTDLHNCVSYIQEPKMLKESIKALYQKYVQHDTSDSSSVDADIQKEHARQREHLEQTVLSLRKKLVKDYSLHQADNVRIMQENVTLIKEINDLRKELKVCRRQIHDLEAVLGLHGKVNKGETNALLTEIAKKTPNAIQAQELEEKNKVIDMQRYEIQRLKGEMDDMAQQISSAIGSQVRLAPVTTNSADQTG